MRLIYFDTLYNRDVTMIIASGTEVTFNERNECCFASGGHRYAIAINRIRSITLLEED